VKRILLIYHRVYLIAIINPNNYAVSITVVISKPPHHRTLPLHHHALTILIICNFAHYTDTRNTQTVPVNILPLFPCQYETNILAITEHLCTVASALKTPTLPFQDTINYT